MTRTPPAFPSRTQPIAVIGAYRLGLLAALALAEAGCEVMLLDPDVELIACLSDGLVPDGDPALTALLQRQLRLERLSFEVGLSTALIDYATVALATPMGQAADEPRGAWSRPEASFTHGPLVRLLKGEWPSHLLQHDVVMQAPELGQACWRMPMPLALSFDERASLAFASACAS